MKQRCNSNYTWWETVDGDSDNDDDGADDAGKCAAEGEKAWMDCNPGQPLPPLYPDRYNPFNYLLSLILLCVRKLQQIEGCVIYR